MLNLQEHYTRNADATGHAASCRSRIIPTMVSEGRALDPDNCERCVYLVGLLDDAAAGRKVVEHGN